MADLSDEDLDEVSLGESVDMIRAPERVSVLAFNMVQEIRRRRAADLSDADREALRFILWEYGLVPDDRGDRERYDNLVHAARVLCERLLGGDQ